MTSTIAVVNTLTSSQNQSSAYLRVNVDLLDGTNEIRIKNKRFRTRYFDYGSISYANNFFIRTLDELRLLISETSSDIEVLSDHVYQASLSKLREAGEKGYSLLPPECREYLEELDARAAEDNKSLMLDFTFPRDKSLFWEMVYTGQPKEPLDIMKFWGFRYPIGYLDWDSDLADRILLRRGIFASTYERLEYSKEEVGQISRILMEFAKNQNLKLYLHSPSDVFPPDHFSESEFFEFLHTDTFIYGIVHFACHCINPDNRGAVDSSLQITAHNQEIILSLARFLGNQKVGFRFKPLVFLNACESSTPKHFFERMNFPSVLLDFGAGGVIATACTLPDKFAELFSTMFYHALFEKLNQNHPAYFSEVLLETRLKFLRNYHNPFGLAYGLCAETSQWLKVEY